MEELQMVPVMYNGEERFYPVDIHTQRRRVHYHVYIDGMSVTYESDGVDGLYTNMPSDPRAMETMPPIGLVHAVKAALQTMMPA